MDFVWSDADYGAVCLVEVGTVEEELAFVGIDVVVELVEVGQGGETRAGDVGDAGEVEAMEDEG